MPTKRCNSCGIAIGGKIVINGFDHNHYGSKCVVRDRLEQNTYDFDGNDYCWFCMQTLNDRGWLRKDLYKNMVQITFKDGRCFVLKHSLLNKLIRSTENWEQLKLRIESRHSVIYL